MNIVKWNNLLDIHKGNLINKCKWNIFQSKCKKNTCISIIFWWIEEINYSCWKLHCSWGVKWSKRLWCSLESWKMQQPYPHLYITHEYEMRYVLLYVEKQAFLPPANMMNIKSFMMMSEYWIERLQVFNPFLGKSRQIEKQYSLRDDLSFRIYISNVINL